jgi:hypothetical protein
MSSGDMKMSSGDMKMSHEERIKKLEKGHAVLLDTITKLNNSELRDFFDASSNIPYERDSLPNINDESNPRKFLTKLNNPDSRSSFENLPETNSQDKRFENSPININEKNNPGELTDSDKKKLLDLQQQFTNSQTDALYLTNLSYAYSLMAQHWIVARKRVCTVIGKPTTGQTLLMVSTKALSLGIQAALAGMTNGAFHAVSGPMVEALGGLGNGIGRSNVASIGGYEGGNPSSIQVDVTKTTLTPLLLNGTTIALNSVPPLNSLLNGWKPGVAGATMTDPLDYFLNLETELRKMAVEIANLRGEAFGSQTVDDSYRAKIKSLLNNNIMELESLSKDAFWGFLFNPMSTGDANKKWPIVNQLLKVRMQRLAWRMYCRAQWSNNVWTYKIAINRDNVKSITSRNILQKPEDWPYKVWKAVNGMPAHWDEICSDFLGHEHTPNHPIYNGNYIESENANVRRTRKSWISMAAVQCCQIKRDFGVIGGGRSLMIDLDKPNLDQKIVINAMFSKDETVARKLCLDLQSPPGLTVRIKEVCFGAPSIYILTQATGKKGRLISSNDIADNLMPDVVRGGRITVKLSKTGISTKDAHIYLLGPFKETGTSKIIRDNNGAPSTNIPISTISLMRADWDLWTNLVAPKNIGKYCITLSSRNELSKIDSYFKDRQTHVPDEWWFEVK